MKEIISILILFVVFSNISNTDDFEYPQNLNFGDINMIVKNKKNYQSNHPVAYYDFKVKNISKDTIDLLNFKIYNNFDSIISIKNYIKIAEVYNNNVTLFPGDDFVLPLDIFAGFIDSLSSRNENLSSNLIIVYHKFYSDRYDTLIINIVFKVIKNPDIIFKVYKTYDQQGFFEKDFGKPTNFKSGTGGYVENYSGKDITIDSINYQIFGKNIISATFRDHNHTQINLPFIVRDSCTVGLYLEVEPIIPELSWVPFTIYGHYHNNEIFKFSDTATHRYRINKTFQFTYTPLFKKTIEIGEEAKGYLRNNLYLWYEESWTLKSLDYSCPPNSVFDIIPFTTIPVSIDSNSNKNLTSFNFKSNTEGLNLIKIFMNFESKSGKKMIYPYIYLINVVKTTNVTKEVKPDFNYIIFPNPAGEYIEIYVTGSHTLKGVVAEDVRIYNVLGEVVQSGPHPFVPSQEGKIRIDVSGLAAGVYFVKIGEWTRSFVKIGN